jgi:hypothetical protein
MILQKDSWLYTMVWFGLSGNLRILRKRRAEKCLPFSFKINIKQKNYTQMPFLNFENRHFSNEEKSQILNALVVLQQSLSGKTAVLTSEERQQYGSVNEQNKLIINKVKDFRDSDPALSSPEIDWDEFTKDFESRNLLQSLIASLNELSRGLDNAKLMHDWDNYQASLIDYQYTKYRNDSGSPGFHTKSEELKQFFNRTSSQNTDITEAPKE